MRSSLVDRAATRDPLASDNKPMSGHEAFSIWALAHVPMLTLPPLLAFFHRNRARFQLWHCMVAIALLAVMFATSAPVFNVLLRPRALPLVLGTLWRGKATLGLALAASCLVTAYALRKAEKQAGSQPDSSAAAN